MIGHVRVAARERRDSWLVWFEPLSVWPATVWGCALGVDAIVSAALVYGRTGTIWLAALTGVGALAVSTAALIVFLSALARSGR